MKKKRIKSHLNFYYKQIVVNDIFWIREFNVLIVLII